MSTKLESILAALDLAQALTEKSAHHPVILQGYKDLRSVIAEMEAGEPVAWTWDTKNQRDGFVDAHFQFSKPDDHPAIANLQPLYAQPNAEPAATEKELRRMLCVAYAGSSAYMDDGEAQDNRDLPCIDFLRDSPTEIRDKMQRRALKALAVQPKAEPVQRKDCIKCGDRLMSDLTDTCYECSQKAAPTHKDSLLVEAGRGPVAGWQERQMFSNGWGDWYHCAPRLPGSPLERVLDQITYQWRPVYAAAPQAKPLPLTDEQIEKLREKTFSTNNPYCPVDSKSMRKAVHAAEMAHGIKGDK